MKVNSGLYGKLYEQVFRKYSKDELQEEHPIKNSRIWSLDATVYDPNKYNSRVQELFHTKSDQYLYKKYLSSLKNPENEIDIEDEILERMIDYLGKFKIQHNLHSDVRAKRLLSDFAASIQDELTSLDWNKRVPENLKPIVEHLMQENWWFCFRGHRAADPNNSWTLVYNVMEFKQAVDQRIRVSKLKRNQKERYKNTFGYIDFEASNSQVLAINLTSKSLEEHCHIKLNIDLHDPDLPDTQKDVFMGEYIQHEHDGHISSGSAMLVNATSRLDTDEPNSGIKHEPGHLPIPTDSDFSELPTPFKHFAFYFQDKKQNTRRTTNFEIFKLSDMLKWKADRAD